jgi:hypothetical protein
MDCTGWRSGWKGVVGFITEDDKGEVGHSGRRSLKYKRCWSQVNVMSWKFGRTKIQKKMIPATHRRLGDTHLR